MLTGLTLAVLAACRADAPTEPEVTLSPVAATVPTDRVDDLTVTSVTDSTAELRWTQVDDGRGRPALYRLKYAQPAITWATATVGCNAKGSSVGSPITCTVRGLGSATAYDFQLMSYRVASGVWQGATYSNVAKGQTSSSRAVDDLTAVGASSTSLRVQWTQVDDHTGHPARYRVRYAVPPMSWSTAAIGCDTTLDGAQIGAPMSCTIEGLTAGSSYDLQLMSYRVVDGVWQDGTLSNVANGRVLRKAEAVNDLSVSAVTDSSVTIRWTEVSDGEGAAAWYRVRVGRLPFDWATAAAACASSVAGTAVGAPRSCTIPGLSASSDYAVQVMSYRNAAGVSDGEAMSNLANGKTAAAQATAQQATAGIWISPAEVARLPMSGTGWTNVLAAANSSCGVVDLTDQEQSTNVCVLAKALVFARTGTASYRTAVVTAISQIVASGTYTGRALSLGRELGAYVVAADLIDLKQFDPTLDASFRAKLRTLRTAYTTGAASSLIDCHEKRPNNWGAHCGATRAAIAVYLGDTADLARTAQVFKGFLGDRASYAGFDYGADLSWQCDAARPVGINPPGCVRNGRVFDGIIPDDQRRSGTFTWPAPHENYVWESLQGLLAQAQILSRAGYPVWDWENRALLRAVTWVNDVNGFPAEGDDRWLNHIVNRAYGTSFPAPMGTNPGKNFGWTDWTHK
ncbi:MAG: fibronectin type III domain-containing protein [Gemmatimonadales bacterium]